MNQRLRLLRKLFLSTLYLSAFTFGGGYVIITLMKQKFVDHYHWIEEEEMLDLVAIAQSCPGVMAVNTSIIIGYHIAGVAGALLTVTGTILPPMIILTIVSMFYVQFRSNPVIALLLKGMQAGVAAVMINMTITMAGNVLKDREVFSLLMLIAASVAAIFFGVDIILILLVCGVAGGIYSWRKRKEVPVGKEED